MKRNLALRIGVCGRHVLAALAVLTILGMATPSASAAVSLFYTADGAPAGGAALTSGVSTGTVTAGTYSYSLTATSNDTSSNSRLNTTTINVTNTGPAGTTLTLVVTGTGYTFGGTATNGEIVQAQTSVQGTGGPATASPVDNTSATASADGSNAKFGAATALLSSSGTTPTGASTTYTFTPAVGPMTNFTIASGATGFSLTQTLAITLGHNDSASFTVVTNVFPPSAVPEPSSLAIAGLGGLGMIGFGLRRRKALGA